MRERHCLLNLNGIDEVFLLVVEEEDGCHQEQEREEAAVSEPEPGKRTHAKGSILKGFKHRRKRIERHQRMKRGVGNHAQRIDHRSGIHP